LTGNAPTYRTQRQRHRGHLATTVILVLKGVSLRVPARGRVSWPLLGGNGAGKTTTLRAVSNLLQRRARWR
jgi:ABC-type branched-subunit amino acid transport system ATPase component